MSSEKNRRSAAILRSIEILEGRLQLNREISDRSACSWHRKSESHPFSIHHNLRQWPRSAADNPYRRHEYILTDIFSTSRTIATNRSAKWVEARCSFPMLLHCLDRKSLLNTKRNYWHFFALALKESKGLYDTVLYVANSQEVKTSTGRGRLFLRFCLQHHRLGDVIQQSFMTEKVVQYVLMKTKSILKICVLLANSMQTIVSGRNRRTWIVLFKFCISWMTFNSIFSPMGSINSMFAGHRPSQWRILLSLDMVRLHWFVSFRSVDVRLRNSYDPAARLRTNSISSCLSMVRRLRLCSRRKGTSLFFCIEGKSCQPFTTLFVHPHHTVVVLRKKTYTLPPTLSDW